MSAQSSRRPLYLGPHSVTYVRYSLYALVSQYRQCRQAAIDPPSPGRSAGRRTISVRTDRVNREAATPIGAVPTMLGFVHGPWWLKEIASVGHSSVTAPRGVSG